VTAVFLEIRSVLIKKFGSQSRRRHLNRAITLTTTKTAASVGYNRSLHLSFCGAALLDAVSSDSDGLDSSVVSVDVSSSLSTGSSASRGSGSDSLTSRTPSSSLKEYVSPLMLATSS